LSKRTADQLSMFGREHLPMSPVRRQYLELKRQYPDAILFFRLGDFFETFDADADLVARELEIALTSRDLGRGERVPMAGVPCAAVDSYAARLIARGHRLAICEQLSEPDGRGPVQRGVVRVLSPGTVVEDGLLTARQSTFLAALLIEGRAAGLAHLDASTGYLAACQVGGPDFGVLLASELCRIGPSECLLPADEQVPGRHTELVPVGCRSTLRPAEAFGPRRAAETLRNQFGLERLEALGLGEAPLAARAAAALLDYVAETLPGALPQFQRLQQYDVEGFMVLDAAARRNLELLAGLRSGGREGSLLEVLDRTRTPMGARLLRRWLAQPLLDQAEIRARQDAVQAVGERPAARADLAALLADLPDLERLAGRAFQGRLAPRDCLALAAGLGLVPRLGEAVTSCGAGLGELRLDPVPEIGHLVAERLSDDPPPVVGPGLMRAGFSSELDEVRALGGDTRRWIASLERQERERTGVRGLKVGHNRVYGYFLEVGQAATRQPTDYYQQQQTGATDVGQHLEKLGYVRKQTLAGAERYITQELKEYELRASRAEQETERLERRLFTELLEALRPLAARVQATAAELARLDCLSSLAEVARERRYVRPELDESRDLVIRGGRHPIVEAALQPGEFVPNDLTLGEDGRILVVTGPNMAGKSTCLRQAALIALLAQIGSFVPADSARLGLVDRIFTRIGARDDLAGRSSTFMVEMTEAANILRNATPRSLVILDEVGRGTSTYDGLALARAILERLHSAPGLDCRTLFATHYHELAGLERELPGIRSVRMEVLERGREVVFLHRLVPGAADRSYGIHVARLAGVPAEVTARAEAILAALEADGPARSVGRPAAPGPDERAALAVVDRLRGLDPLRLTPLDALSELQLLRELIDRFGHDGHG
jgi:DNA mismatch repair protein MutS